ncbi:RraA family protein [Inquilinus limosus]|uniref:Putative 4-hydroxy-4-methyl-2-oxoglutarate aldolase n=1 Tax=Inquilinus limosus MP06 TaxID=1398085 RepID=A0A0A0D3D8_9PROT|nr:4-hydroxy-4-methyl-2-oxoglutarate aldolase [Inquilinus limosus]KGM32599.1 4-hydroxy-4-methyl-2-oxoglutarate aldolase [Inquilinus limosus MP06]
MPDYRIAPMPQQIAPVLVEKLRRVETATIGHSQHWGFMDRGIQPLLRGKRIAGAAVTLAIPGQDSTLLHHTLGLLRPGDILVVDRLGDDKHACWGGGVTIAAKAAGAVGGIVDGPCTDLAEIEDSDFPMWCRGMSPITTRLYNLGGTLNLPVSCGGVPVRAGDVILADESGVLVLPADQAEAIADAALVRQQRGEATQERVKAGEKLGDISGASRMVLEALNQAS